MTFLNNIYTMVFGLYFIAGTDHSLINPPVKMKMPMFSDNSRVYYVPGTTYTRVNTVRNMSIVSRRT